MTQIRKKGLHQNYYLKQVACLSRLSKLTLKLTWIPSKKGKLDKIKSWKYRLKGLFHIPTCKCRQFLKINAEMYTSIYISLNGSLRVIYEDFHQISKLPREENEAIKNTIMNLQKISV